MKRITSLAALLAVPVLVAGVATAPATHAAIHTADRKGAYDVTLRVSDREPTVGDRISLKGRVHPAAPGSSVVLQVLYDNRNAWKTLDKSAVGKNGRYLFAEKIKTDRTRKYRVVKAGDARHGGTHSNKVKVVGYGWTPLAALPTANDVGWYLSGTSSVNGKAYPESASSSLASGSVDVNLARSCTSLDAVYGLDDSSPSTATATLGVSLDGVPALTQTFGLAQAVHRVLDVNGTFRVTLTYSVTDGGHAVVGTPMALCHS